MGIEGVKKVLVATEMGRFGIAEAEAFIAQHEGEIFLHDGTIPEEEQRPGMHISYQPGLSPQDIEEQTKDGQFEGLVVGPEHVTEQVNVQWGIRIGIGVNNYPVETWKAQGKLLMNTPGINAHATAEYTMASLLTLLAPKELRKASAAALIGELYSNDLRNYHTRELRGKTLAVMGVGAIGELVIKEAQAFGMQVRVWSQSFNEVDANTLGVTRFNTPEEAAQGVDAISLHFAQTKETEGLIDASVFNAAKKGVAVVNAARGPVINTQDLEKAVKSGQVGSFVVDADLFKTAPSPAQPYKDIANGKCHHSENDSFLVLPHLFGDTTHEARSAGSVQALTQAYALLANNQVINGVVIPQGKGYINLGAQLPKGVGRVSKREATTAFEANAADIQKLSAELAKAAQEGNVSKLLACQNQLNGLMPTGRLLSAELKQEAQRTHEAKPALGQHTRRLSDSHVLAEALDHYAPALRK